MGKTQKALDKTKVHLMTRKNSEFLSNVSMQLTHVFDSEIPTACTNGKYIKYNPEFFLGLDKEQRLGLLAHEVWHVCFLHMARIGNKDPKIWNKAADYIINNLLIKAGYTLPPGGLYDPYFDNWSTEQVYEYLKQKKNDFSDSSPDDLIYTKTNEELEQDITNIVLKAVHKANATNPGSIPSEISTSVKELINPKLNWKELLFNYVTEDINDRLAWHKPDIIYLPEVYLPTMHSKGLNVTVAIDTSGSLFDDLSTDILPELVYLKQSFNFAKLTILDCDTEIHNIYEVEENDSIQDLQFTGCGGTSFYPVIKYCNDNDTNLLIYFTDLEARQIEEEQSYPIIWICPTDHEPAPIGTTIYVNP